MKNRMEFNATKRILDNLIQWDMAEPDGLAGLNGTYGIED